MWIIIPSRANPLFPSTLAAIRDVRGRSTVSSVHASNSVLGAKGNPFRAIFSRRSANCLKL